MMDRRTFIGAVAANLVAVPLAAISQPSEKVHRIGYLQLGNPPVPAGPDWDPAPLRELGWIEGKNLVIEYRYAGESADRLPALARELVRLNVEIIVTSGTDAAVAAKAATTRIPIVMYSAGDPVGAGLVARLSGSRSNITGFSIVSTELDAKRLEVLRQVLPRVQRVGELVNPKNPIHKVGRKEYEEVFRNSGCSPSSSKCRREPAGACVRGTDSAAGAGAGRTPGQPVCSQLRLDHARLDRARTANDGWE